MNDSPLLSGKFTAVKLPEIRAPRHALLNRFYKEADKRVIFVSSPAGYGKTVSTLLWLEDCGRETIWIGLDDYDNTPSIFYKLFCTGMVSAQPDNKAMADILRHPSFSSSPVEHTIALLAEFVPDGKQYAVVLDDMHLVVNEEIRKSGLLVQKRLPSSFITLILTRNEIGPQYVDTVGKDKAGLITANDLAFSVEEIQKYFSLYGRPIAAREAEAVHTITNGWAIGVNALALSGQTEIGQSSGQILGNYIKAHFWGKWDKDLRVFMLKTAIVDVITPELAKMLTGYDNSLDILRDLCAKNSFISYVSEGRYRYHPLFLDFLRDVQEDRENINKTDLYKTAAAYYAANGDFFSARRYAILSGDEEAILKSYNLMNNGQSVSIDEYVNFYRSLLKEDLDNSICRNYPYIYSTHVWYYFIIGDAPKLEYYLDILYECLPHIIEKYPQFAEISILITAIDYRVGLAQKIKYFSSFAGIASLGGTMQGTSISMQMPFAHRAMIDFYELVGEKVMDGIRSSLGLLLKVQSNLVMPLLHSGILYEQNRLKEALETTKRIHMQINESTKDEIVFSAFIHQAAIYAAMGNNRLFVDSIRRVEQYMDKNSLYFFRPNLMAFKTKIALMNSEKGAARAWLDSYFATETEQLELYKIFQYFTTARAYIVLSQTDKAMKYILKLKKLSIDFRRPTDLAEAQVLQAIVEWATGNKKEAVSTLETALIAMQGYNFIRIFADEGAAVLPILKKLTLNLKKDSYKGSLKAQFLHQVTIAAYEHSKRYRGIATNVRLSTPVKLSKQQKLIIHMLSKGYKNAEIAQVTGLTIHTIKSHCAAAYKKLDVNNAMDAVLKARELGMID